MTGKILPQQNPEFVKKLFTSIAPRYDVANHALSGGIDFWWRRRAAKIVRDWKPKNILDLATGSGDLALTLQKHCPESSVTGADFCEEMLARATAKGLAKTVVADAMNLPFANGSFDVVTVAFGLRNMQSWSGALREMRRVLTNRGHLLILDFSMPPQPFGTLYRFYLHRCLPWIAGAITRHPEAYAYLGDSIEEFPHGRAMCDLINAAGFANATAQPLNGGIVSLYTAEAYDGLM